MVFWKNLMQSNITILHFLELKFIASYFRNTILTKWNEKYTTNAAYRKNRFFSLNLCFHISIGIRQLLLISLNVVTKANFTIWNKELNRTSTKWEISCKMYVIKMVKEVNQKLDSFFLVQQSVHISCSLHDSS